MPYTPAWYERAGARRVIFGLLLVAGTLGLALVEGRSGFGWSFLAVLSTTVVAASFAALVSELPPFTSYIEERLRSLAQSLDKPFLQRVEDPKFLHDQLTVDARKKIFRAAGLSLFDGDISEYEALHPFFDKAVTGLLKHNIWRKDYRLTVTLTFELVNGRRIACQSYCRDIAYLNLSGGRVGYRIPNRFGAEKIDGVDPEQLIAGVKITCNGQDVTPLPVTEDTPSSIKKDYPIQVDLGRDPLQVHLEAIVRTPVGDPLVLIPNEPTVGLRLIIRHPRNVKPALACSRFWGDLDSGEPAAGDGLHIWEYKGILFPGDEPTLTYTVRD